MAFKGNGSSGLTRNSSPPWSNSQRGVSIAAWVKYDGSGTTGAGTIAATFNKAGTVGAANRLFKNVAAYGSIVNSESTAPAITSTIASSVKAGGWQFLANQFLTTTLRKGFVSGIGSNHGLDQIRVTTSLGSHTDQTGVCVGHLDIITPIEYLQSSFIVAHVMYFGSILDPSEIWALANGGHPLDPHVCRRPGQYYPLLDDGYCAVTGLKLTDVGAPAWVYDSPALSSPNRLRRILPFSEVAAPAGGIFLPLVGAGGLVGPSRGLAS